MKDVLLPSTYKPKNHAKMYAPDSFLSQLKAVAKAEGLTSSAFMLLAVKDKIKKVNR